MNSISPTSIFDRLLAKTGGYYILLTIFIAQLATSPLGVFLAAEILTTNSDLPNVKIGQLALVAGGSLLIRNAFLILYVYLTNRVAFSRLNALTKGIPLDKDTEQENIAWRQITSLAWRFIVTTSASLFLFTTPIVLVYLSVVLKGTTDQVLYTLIAAIVVGLSLAVLEVLLVERMLAPARLKLVPADFESQITGVPGVRMLTKFLVIFIVLILVTVLLVAPIGYHQTTRVLYEEIGSQKVLSDLQIQSLIVGSFSLLFGFGLSYLLTRGLSQSIKNMVDTFNKVEQGDLKQRISISATDEIGELSVYTNRMLSRLEEFQSGLEGQVKQKTALLQATLEVGRVSSGILNPDELITRAVHLISDRFGYYYAAIFLIDPTGRWAVLKDATGEAGTTLKARGHKLELMGKSMVGSTISSRRARIALDVGAESVRFDNPLLPETRSEIALPLIVGDRTLGALDVQSTQEAAFQEDDINTLQSMANQVAIALENARLFQQTEQSLEELKATQRQYVAEAWSKLKNERDEYEYISGSELAGKGESVTVPIALRDQTIGHLMLEGDQEWSPEEKSMIEAVATQAALALENARLLQESQQLALRERLAAEIITKIWSSSNIDSILQTSIKELGRALNADDATIEIEPD